MTDVMGLAEVAELFGVRPNVVANWRKRRPDFPRPRFTLRMGPVWYGQRAELLRWKERN